MYKKEFTAKDGTKILLREPKRSDIKELLKYINELAVEKRNGLLINRRVTLAYEKKWLKEVLEDKRKNKRIELLVIHNKKVVGDCNIRRKKGAENHRAEIGIALLKEFRGKGIGTIMLKELFKLAKERMKGLEIIELRVASYNRVAKRLYKKFGFKKVAAIPKAIKEEGKYYSEEIMQLHLK
jgi:RimJ/RimL family protein N-acetyltransferase